MKMWLLIILLVFMCSVAASLTQQVFGQYGLDLHLPLSQLCREPFLDIFGGETHIGNYVDHKLEGLNTFKDRLQFEHENCTFIIKSFSKVDGHHFKFTNFGPTVRMDFEVIVTAVRDTPDEFTSDECTSGLFALGFSMDQIICLIFIILAETMKEKCWNNDETVSCIKQAVISFLGKDKRIWINFACIINKVFSMVCQTISLILLACCGKLHGTDCLFITATAFTVLHWLFAAVWIYFTFNCNEGNLNPIKRNQPFCYILEWVLSLAFLAFIYCLYFSQYSVNSTRLVWVLVASLLISVIVKIVIFILYRTLLLTPEERNTNMKKKPVLDTDGLL